MANSPIDWIFSFKDTSLEESLEELRVRLLAKINHRPIEWSGIPAIPSTPNPQDYWVYKIYVGYAIVTRDGRQYWRVDYRLGEAGNLEVDDFIPVEMTWVPIGIGTV